jgi:hypothetical protein
MCSQTGKEAEEDPMQEEDSRKGERESQISIPPYRDSLPTAISISSYPIHTIILSTHRSFSFPNTLSLKTAQAFSPVLVAKNILKLALTAAAL